MTYDDDRMSDYTGGDGWDLLWFIISIAAIVVMLIIIYNEV